MSSRSCNYCDLQDMKKRYKDQTLHVVSRNGWRDVYFVPAGETLDTRRDPETWNALSDQWKCSMMEIGDKCDC